MKKLFILLCFVTLQAAAQPEEVVYHEATVALYGKKNIAATWGMAGGIKGFHAGMHTGIIYTPDKWMVPIRVQFVVIPEYENFRPLIYGNLTWMVAGEAFTAFDAGGGVQKDRLRLTAGYIWPMRGDYYGFFPSQLNIKFSYLINILE